jgi:hypothetical protein
MEKRILGRGTGWFLILVILGMVGGCAESNGLNNQLPAQKTEQTDLSGGTTAVGKPSVGVKTGQAILLAADGTRIGEVNFFYDELTEKYISAVSWPPQISLAPGDFSCLETTGEAGGQTISKKLIEGRTYCVTVMASGAAGTIYKEYSYLVAVKGQLATAKFTLRWPQCGNYADPERKACEQEQANFALDKLVDGMIQSIKL